ncbi:hypothetical protein JXQ70_10130 [bacterium]|nr:hypothetical protein [bacterium]
MSIQDPFIRLEQRIKEFGNHFNKYHFVINRHRDELVRHLEKHGVLDKVMLYKPANDLCDEMETIMSLTSDRSLKLDFLACYYALQYIILNVRCVDILRMSILVGSNNLAVYRNFMRQVGEGFRKLTACYIERVLHLFYTSEELGEYVVIGVGTRADQDDIDIGIIDKGDYHREKLNIGLSKIIQEMMKRACYLHLHISEHVGTQSYSASINEYQQLLDKEIHDFVIINEMLNAWPIFGSWKLFRDFQEQVISRYYFEYPGNLKYHEGFLRGILGEILALRVRPLKDDRLHPKDDALRMIKGMMSVSKTILGIEKIGSWDVITLLQQHSTQFREQFHWLEESLIFIETFRFLYQLFISQSEDIYLQDRNDWRNLNTVARTMGYNDMGVIKAWNHLLIGYHQYVNQANRAIDELFPWVREHLIKHSSMSSQLACFQGELAGVKPGQSDTIESQTRCIVGNITQTFTDQVRFFRGTTFWDDILDKMCGDEGALMLLFVRDIQRLEPMERSKIVQFYAACGQYSSLTIITVLTFLASKSHEWNCRELFYDFCRAYLQVFQTLPNAHERLINIFNYQPVLINNFFHIIPDEFVTMLEATLTAKHWDDRIEREKSKFLRLLSIHKLSSRHFHRFVDRMLDRNHECIRFLDSDDKIQMISVGLLGKVDEAPTYKSKKEQLGDYYDLEYMRVGIQTLLGENVETTGDQYTLFVDNYLQTLFNICKQELDSEQGQKTPMRDLLAVFSAGGHAREQAFDNDYDLIVLLNSNDQHILDHAIKIISRMNSEIIKRGTLPHYRFADHFGRYVTTFSELKQFLQGEHQETFIDKSQLLGCRQVVGSHIFMEDFMAEIIVPFLFDQKVQYTAAMIEEYYARHEQSSSEEHYESSIDVKDCHGGLRDIEMLLMIYKACFEISKNISLTLFEMLCEADPAHARVLKRLQRTYQFLAQLRDFYRLTVAADDMIIWQELQRPTAMLERARLRHPFEQIERIKKRTLQTVRLSARSIDQLMQEFTTKGASYDRKGKNTRHHQT